MSYTLTAQPNVAWGGLVASDRFTGWYWCDLDGAHVESAPPDTLPAATHVWAWGDGVWGRWRIDPLGATTGTPAVIGAVLETTAAGGDDDVVVYVLETTTWPVDGPVNLAHELRGLPVRVLQVTDPVQVTFLGVRR